MVSLMAVFLTLTAAYIAVLLWAAHKESARFQVVGPLLMVRTQMGKRAIDKIAKRKWWGKVADVFIVLTVLSGLLMVVLVVWQNTLLFTHTEAVRQNPPQVEQTLAIPGINPVIPVGYGLFALVVALVIHEGGHGVLARFSQLKVKSLGLLFLVLPVGAFVEPDEEELQGATLRDKLRMFASGPGPNMVLGGVCVLLFAQVMLPALAPAHTGVALMGVSEGMPAAEAGLEPGMFVTGIEGNDTETYAAFATALNQTYPDATWSWNHTEGPGANATSNGTGNGTANQTAPRNVTLTIEWWDGGETGTVELTPADKYLWYKENAPQANDPSFRNKPFLGVNPAGPDRLNGIMDNLIHPFENQGVQGALFYLALPFVNLSPFPTAFHDIYEIGGLLAGLGAGFWVLANTLYWLFWINVVLGTFNALPLGPLDGGHMFRHTIHWIARKRQGIRDSDLRVLPAEDGSPKYIGRTPAVQTELDRVDRVVSLWNRTVGFGLLALILAPLIVPQFL